MKLNFVLNAGKFWGLSKVFKILGEQPEIARYGIHREGTQDFHALTQADCKKALENHTLASELWASCIREARTLACLVESPALISGEEADPWVQDFSS